MKNKYKWTIRACFFGYIIQAIVNNFIPLLFIRFGTEFSIPLSDITVLITINFFIQLIVDLTSAFYIDKIGYRASAVIAHVFSAIGLFLLSFLPDVIPGHFLGILISVFFYAIGGGLLEVVISPMVEACPSEHKDKTMSMLHSFYCWGSVAVVLVSTLFFNLFSIENWRILAIVWAALPALNTVAFLVLPVASLNDDGKKGLKLSELFKTKLFWVFAIIICCAGASELAISQWASAFTETALGLSKAVSDLAGPMIFAVFMGISRTVYGKFGEKINLDKMMLGSALLTLAAYLMIALTKNPYIALFGIAVSGFAVGILWPGTYSKAAASIKGGGTAMFAFLAMGGDIGCTLGPTVAGYVASATGENLKSGILAAAVFPAVLILAMCCLNKTERKSG